MFRVYDLNGGLRLFIGVAFGPKGKMANEKEQMIIKKAQFYFSLNLPCHIKIKPTGFRNVKIISEFIEEGQYFIVQDMRKGYRPERLFLFQIHDIKDYEEPIKEGEGE
jgi:hypothetical protein